MKVKIVRSDRDWIQERGDLQAEDGMEQGGGRKLLMYMYLCLVRSTALKNHILGAGTKLLSKML